MYFENSRSSKYYGLAITVLGKGNQYLSVKNFEFYVKGKCLIVAKVSGDEMVRVAAAPKRPLTYA